MSWPYLCRTTQLSLISFFHCRGFPNVCTHGNQTSVFSFIPKLDEATILILRRGWRRLFPEPRFQPAILNTVPSPLSGRDKIETCHPKHSSFTTQREKVRHDWNSPSQTQFLHHSAADTRLKLAIPNTVPSSLSGRHKIETCHPKHSSFITQRQTQDLPSQTQFLHHSVGEGYCLRHDWNSPSQTVKHRSFTTWPRHLLWFC